MRNLTHQNVTPRANAALLALACGDLYGSQWEGLGLAGFDLSTVPLTAEPEAGSQTTDDTHLAVLLLQHLLNGWDVEAYRSDVAAWSRTPLAAEQAIGVHTYAVFNGTPERELSEGNGFVMGVLPSAYLLLDNGFTQEELTAWLYEVQAVTQHTAGVEVVLYLLGFDVPTPPYQQGCTAWLQHTLYTVEEVLATSETLLDVFQGCVRASGDTDTNAAIASAVFAGRNGLGDFNPFDYDLPASVHSFRAWRHQ